MCQPPTVLITFNFESASLFTLVFFQIYQDFPPCSSIQSWLSSLNVLYADDDSCIAVETFVDPTFLTGVTKNLLLRYMLMQLYCTCKFIG